MMGLRATDELGARCDEGKSSRCCERHEGMKIEKKIKETKMRRNENTIWMCQWLVLTPLNETMEVTSIYIVSQSTCITIFWRIF